MWPSIAEILLHVVRFFVKNQEERERYERAIMDAVSRFNSRTPSSTIIRDCWNEITHKMEEDLKNGVQTKEETKTTQT